MPGVQGSPAVVRKLTVRLDDMLAQPLFSFLSLHGEISATGFYQAQTKLLVEQWQMNERLHIEEWPDALAAAHVGVVLQHAREIDELRKSRRPSNGARSFTG